MEGLRLHYAGRRCAALLPGAAFRVVPGAGHLLQEEAGDRVGREVAALLRGGPLPPA